MRNITRVFVAWMPLAIAIIGLSMLVYVAVQQEYRQSLNDPQIQMAEDAASALDYGADAGVVIPPPAEPIDMSMSLAPWIALLKSDGTIYMATSTSGVQYVVSTAIGARRSSDADATSTIYFSIPRGVLQSAALGVGKNTSTPGEDRVTWQPNPMTRQAIVAVEITAGQYKGDFVVSGRGMREVEFRESALEQLIALGALCLLVVTFLFRLLVGGPKR